MTPSNTVISADLRPSVENRLIELRRGFENLEGRREKQTLTVGCR